MSQLSSPFPITAAPAPPRRLLKYARRAVAAAVVLVGLVGLLHLPFATRLLRMLSPAGVCPLMRGSPAQIDRAHAIGAAAIRSAATSAAPARPALGFTLDATRKPEVEAWAARHGITCASIAGNQNLQRCANVPAAAVGEPAALGDLEEVTFEFLSTGELVVVQSLRRHLTADQAARTAAALAQTAATALGAPTTSAGAPTVEHLSHGVLSSYVAVHTFTDYRATVTATNLAETGMMVREEYLSAR